MHTDLLQHPSLLEITISPWQTVHEASRHIDKLLMNLKEVLPAGTPLLNPYISRALELSSTLFALSLHTGGGASNKTCIIEALLFLGRAGPANKHAAARFASIQRTLQLLGHGALVNEVSVLLNGAMLDTSYGYGFGGCVDVLQMPVPGRVRPRPGPIVLPPLPSFLEAQAGSVAPSQADAAAFGPSTRALEELLAPLAESQRATTPGQIVGSDELLDFFGVV